MGDFSKSVKKALSQVFGRGDLEEVLGEEANMKEANRKISNPIFIKLFFNIRVFSF